MSETKAQAANLLNFHSSNWRQRTFLLTLSGSNYKNKFQPFPSDFKHQYGLQCEAGRMVSGDSGTEERLSGDRYTGFAPRSKRKSNDTGNVINHD